MSPVVNIGAAPRSELQRTLKLCYAELAHREEEIDRLRDALQRIVESSSDPYCCAVAHTALRGLPLERAEL